MTKTPNILFLHQQGRPIHRTFAYHRAGTFPTYHPTKRRYRHNPRPILTPRPNPFRMGRRRIRLYYPHAFLCPRSDTWEWLSGYRAHLHRYPQPQMYVKIRECFLFRISHHLYSCLVFSSQKSDFFQTEFFNVCNSVFHKQINRNQITRCRKNLVEE